MLMLHSLLDMLVQLAIQLSQPAASSCGQQPLAEEVGSTTPNLERTRGCTVVLG